MTGEQMWRAFAAARGVEGARYDVWAFGGDPDGLARLALDGGKTATSSAHPLYALEGEPLPEAGEYSVILDGRGEAVCVIRTERVTVLPYRDVGGEHARREGEGDLSLAYWRRVHEAFLPRRRHRRGCGLPRICRWSARSSGGSGRSENLSSWRKRIRPEGV